MEKDKIPNNWVFPAITRFSRNKLNVNILRVSQCEPNSLEDTDTSFLLLLF